MTTLTDPRLQVASEVCAEAQKVASTFQSEDGCLDPQIITFAPEYKQKGLAVICTVGTVWGMRDDGIALVPQRTLDILDKMGIPYILCD